MARIENSKPKETSGAYTQLFGNDDLGKLITKVQTTIVVGFVKTNF